MQDAERVAAYAAEMSEFLLESGLAETKAFVRSFVKQIVVRPEKATIHYTIPTPEDSPIGGADIAEIALGRRVMKSVSPGEPVEPRMDWNARASRFPKFAGMTARGRGAAYR